MSKQQPPPTRRGRGVLPAPLPSDAPPWTLRLRAAREKAGLSIAALAQDCRDIDGKPIDARRVSHYERGVMPPADVLVALARRLGTTSDAILFG